MTLKTLEIIMKRAITLLIVVWSIVGFGFAQGTFTNPILGGDFPDPTILRDGQDYYLTNSAFDYQPGLVVYHSRDLVHWEPISYALRTYLGSIWAPDIKNIKENTIFISPFMATVVPIAWCGQTLQKARGAILST